MFDFEPALKYLESRGLGDWAETLRTECATALDQTSHGLLTDWISTVQQFQPGSNTTVTMNNGHVVAGDANQSGSSEGGGSEDGSSEDGGSEDGSNEDGSNEGGSGEDGSGQGGCAKTTSGDLRDRLMSFHPWRKGPLEICGQTINTEWRSDWKWDRACEAVELRDRLVLDVGCGNGYFGYRMLHAGASMVIGLDPFHLFVMQHELMKRLIGPVPNFVLPVADTVLHRKLKAFDVAFSMGVLYHRTSPIDHLHVLSGSVKRGGQVVLETLVIDDPSETVLVPDGRYAMMRNVWFLPSVSMLLKWMKRTGFENLQVVDVTPTTVEEQRSTDWMTFDSLPNFLAPNDSTKTIEGYPAPLRATIHATVR